MTQSRQISDDQVLRELETQGYSWQDYILIGDPAVICSVHKTGIAALLIEDEDLASAAVDLLTRRGARHFKDLDELNAAGIVRPEKVE
jgi:hypothetical protein